MLTLAQCFFSSLQTTPIGKARVIYEKLVQYFPTVGKYWKLWAEHEVVFPPISHNDRILLCMRNCHCMLLFAVIAFVAEFEMGRHATGLDEREDHLCHLL